MSRVQLGIPGAVSDPVTHVSGCPRYRHRPVAAMLLGHALVRATVQMRLVNPKDETGAH